MSASRESHRLSPRCGKVAPAVVWEGAVSASEVLFSRRKEHPSIAFITGPRLSLRFPSGRYTHTDPPRREFGLHLLAAPFARAAAQQPHPRSDEARLLLLGIRLLSILTLAEMEPSRRVVETPRTEIKREMRIRLLAAQGAYLCALCVALAAQFGEAAAPAKFERLLTSIV